MVEPMAEEVLRQTKPETEVAVILEKTSGDDRGVLRLQQNPGQAVTARRLPFPDDNPGKGDDPAGGLHPAQAGRLAHEFADDGFVGLDPLPVPGFQDVQDGENPGRKAVRPAGHVRHGDYPPHGGGPG